MIHMTHTTHSGTDADAIDSQARDAWRRADYPRWSSCVVALLDLDDGRAGIWCAVAEDWLRTEAALDTDRVNARLLAAALGAAINSVRERRRTLERVEVILTRWAVITDLAHARTLVWWGIAEPAGVRVPLAKMWRAAWAACGWISQTSDTLRYRQSPRTDTGPCDYPTGARLEILRAIGAPPRAKWQYQTPRITHADRIPLLPVVSPGMDLAHPSQ